MKENKSALIATIIIAVLAVISAVFAVWRLSEKDENNGSGRNTGLVTDTSYQPTETEIIEAKSAAGRLAKDNYSIVSLFYTNGLKYEPEPYGNYPEDGYYTAISEEYKTVDDIFALVDNTLVSDAAEWIKKNEALTGGNGPIYADKKGAIGLNAEFKPEENYKVVWSKFEYEITFVSETECELMLQLTDSDGNEVLRETKMLKIDGQWLLEELIY